MQRLIEALLSYSTADFKGKIFEKTDLNLILDEVKSDLEELITAKGAVIESERLPLVSVIPFQFRQLLANLISNGIKYSRSGVTPHIQVSAHTAEDGKGRRFGEISVADNGIGFDERYQHKIFELFQRLHGKHEFVGTGIGLAICKKIVENHKGTIRAASTPGEGSVFTVSLPLKR
jgi:signal transduction histidine kinase